MMEKKSIYTALGITLLAVGILGGVTENVHASESDSSIVASNNQDVVNLSDLKWTDDSYCGYGDLELGTSTLILGGQEKKFDTAIKAHASSRLTYDISKYSSEYDRLLLYAGIEQETVRSDSSVRFIISTSIDGKKWNKKVTKEAIGSANAIPVDVDISDAKWLRLEADDEGSNGADHAVYCDAKLQKGVTTSFLKAEQYEEKLKSMKTLPSSSVDQKILLQKMFMDKIGFDELQFAYDSGNKDIVDMANFILKDEELLQYFNTATKFGSGSYSDVLKVFAKLFKQYGSDFNDSQHASLYKRMMVAMSYIFGSPDGYDTSQNGGRNLFDMDPIKRYSIYKDFYLHGKLYDAKQFESASVDTLTWSMGAKMDDNEILWLNDFARNHGGKDYALGGYDYMDYRLHWDLNSSEFYDAANEKKWNDKYDFEKYGIKYGEKGVAKIWMNMETGGICGPISNLAVCVQNAFGLPARVEHQPDHMPSLLYKKDDAGNYTWSIETSIAGYEVSNLYYPLLLNWGSEPWADQSKNLSYIYLIQRALDDESGLLKVKEYIALSNMYAVGTKEREDLLEQALDVQGYNLDVIDELVASYHVNKDRTDIDFVNLAKKLIPELKNYPVPFVDTLNLIKKYLGKESLGTIDIMMHNSLEETQNIGKTDLSDPNAVKAAIQLANYYLGNNTDELASFSFNGKHPNTITLNSKYDGIGMQIRYSLDNGKTWKQTTDHQIQLSDKEVKSLTISSSILIGFMGDSDNYKIPILADEENIDTSKVFVDDYENKLLGDQKVLDSLEYSIDDGKTWQIFDSEKTFSGDIKLRVRKMNHENYLVTGENKEVEYKFTDDKNTERESYVSRSHLSIKEFSSEEPAYRQPASQVIDGDEKTAWSTHAPDNDSYIVLETDIPIYLSRLDYNTSENLNNSFEGHPQSVTISTSMDGKNWEKVAHVENIYNDSIQETLDHTIKMDKVTLAKYIKFQGDTSNYSADGKHINVSEIRAYEDTTKSKSVGPEVATQDVTAAYTDDMDASKFIKTINGSTDFSNYSIEFVDPLPNNAVETESTIKVKVTDNQTKAATIVSMKYHQLAAPIVVTKELSIKFGQEIKGTDFIQEINNNNKNFDGYQVKIVALPELNVNDPAYNVELTVTDKNNVATNVTGRLYVDFSNVIPKKVSSMVGEKIRPQDFIENGEELARTEGLNFTFVSEPNWFKEDTTPVALKVTDKFEQSVQIASELNIRHGNDIVLQDSWGGELMSLIFDAKNSVIHSVINQPGKEMYTQKRVVLYDRDYKEKASITVGQKDTPEKIADAFNNVSYEDGDYIELDTVWANKGVSIYDTGKITYPSDQNGTKEIFKIKNNSFVKVTDPGVQVESQDRTVKLGEKVTALDFIKEVNGSTDLSGMKAEFTNLPDLMSSGDKEVEVKVTNIFGTSTEVKANLSIVDSTSSNIVITGWHGEKRLLITPNTKDETFSVIQDSRGSVLTAVATPFMKTTLYDKDLNEKKVFTVMGTDTPNVAINALDGVEYADGDYLKLEMADVDSDLYLQDGTDTVLSSKDSNKTEVFQIKDDKFVRIDTSKVPVINSEDEVSYDSTTKLSQEQFLKDIHYESSFGAETTVDLSDIILSKVGKYKAHIIATNTMTKATTSKDVIVNVTASKLTIDSDNTTKLEVNHSVNETEFLKSIHLNPSKDETAHADLSKVNFTKVGTYDVVVKVQNNSGDKATKIVKLEIIKTDKLISNLQYTVGENTITGNYTGDIENARLYVNGESMSWGGSFQDGEFTYLINPNMIKSGDKVTISLYGSSVKLLDEDDPVLIK
jgi:F5/8 type C domain.